MTATTPLPTQLSGRPLAGDRLLLPPNAPGTPPEVLEAQALVVESMGSYAEAGAVLRAARAELAAAPRLDKQRDSAALAAGKTPPRDRLETAAAEAVKAAERRHNAEAGLLASRQTQLGAAISEHHAAWAASLGKIVAEVERRALGLVEQLAAAADQLEAARAVAEGLEQWPMIRQLSQARFFKEDEGAVRRQREQVEADLVRADEQGYGSGRQIDRSVPALLTALRFEVRGRPPRAW